MKGEGAELPNSPLWVPGLSSAVQPHLPSPSRSSCRAAGSVLIPPPPKFPELTELPGRIPAGMFSMRGARGGAERGAAAGELGAVWEEQGDDFSSKLSSRGALLVAGKD